MQGFSIGGFTPVSTDQATSFTWKMGFKIQVQLQHQQSTVTTTEAGCFYSQAEGNIGEKNNLNEDCLRFKPQTQRDKIGQTCLTVWLGK